MILNKVLDIVSSELNVSKDELTLETDLQTDLGADSLDAVELMMTLESKFDIQIPDEEAQKFRLIKDIVNYLENK